jgi:hypothetical protein
MFKGWELFLLILGYLSLLFAIAYLAERREKAGMSIVSNPYVYSLSLAVYCTSWTFYGSVGRAATSGFSFLTIYLGPTLMAALWAVILKKMIGIAKKNRITTISDFIGARYGNSLFLSAFVTLVAVVGITPYLGLQIKAIISTLTILAGQTEGWPRQDGISPSSWACSRSSSAWARCVGTSQSHFCHSSESLIKLVAFCLSASVTYFFDGLAISSRGSGLRFGDLLMWVRTR